MTLSPSSSVVQSDSSMISGPYFFFSLEFLELFLLPVF